MIRKHFIAFAAVAMLAAAPLAGCASDPSNGGGGGGISSLFVGNTADDKALYAAEAAFNVTAQAYVTADSRGQLSADQKAKLKPIFAEAFVALQTARAAKKAGDSGSVQAQTAFVLEAIGRAKKLIPGPS